MSEKSHTLQGWDESESINIYTHKKIRRGTEVNMMRAYRFRIYPSSRQIDMLNSTLNLCRELYNAMLEQRIYAYRSGRKVNYRSQQDEIPALKDKYCYGRKGLITSCCCVPYTAGRLC